MDPTLKEYLDKPHQDAKTDSVFVLKQLQTQSSQIEDLLPWKPDLEARYAKLETTVTTLKAAVVNWSDASPPSAASYARRRSPRAK